MKTRIVFVMILVFFVLCLKNAVACGQITTWKEAYSSFLSFVPEDVTVNNDPRKSPVSNRQVTSFYATTSSWNVSDSQWHLEVRIMSYQNPEEAAAEFPLTKPAVPDYAFIDNRKDFYTFSYSIVDHEFGLGGVYQSCIVSILGWGDYNEKITADYLRSEFMALFSDSKALIDDLCGLVPVNHAPEIRMTPQPGKGYPLEFSILKGEGFQIEIHDEDGIKGEDSNWKLDWSKFKVFVNGREQTVHFLESIRFQQLLYGWNEETGTTLILSIRPDPQKLMSEHNLFNIKDNGTYQIELEICDTDGMCGSCKHDIVFNPVVAITKEQKYHKTDGGYIELDGVYLGNIGKPCKTKIFVALFNPLTNTFWTYGHGEYWKKDEFIYVIEYNEFVTKFFDLTGTTIRNIWVTQTTSYDDVLASLVIGFNTEDQFLLDWAPIENPIQKW